MLAATGAHAIDIEFSGKRVKRQILALYDSRHERQPHETRIHRFAEMPLNHLGYVVAYKDVNGPLPQPWELSSYRGVLTWFLEPLADAARSAAWLDEAGATGLKHVVLGDVAPPAPIAAIPAITRILARLGLEYTDEYVDVTFRSRLAEVDAAVVGFERPLDKALPDHPMLVAMPGKARVHLAIETKGKDRRGAARGGVRPPASATSAVSAVVTTSPAGGLATQSFTTYYEPSTDRVLWTLNPFRFFRLALGDDRFPIPDTTTISGRRIYFSHIDGDGWNNQTELERYRDLQMLASEVILKEAIEPYPDLPVSIGVIGGDVDFELGGLRNARRIAREIYQLPQVEVATHSYTHPYDWQFFERYDRAREEQKIETFQRPEQPLRERMTNSLIRMAGKEPPPSLYFNKYIAGSDDLPRTYLKRPFDLNLEIQGAIKLAESFAPQGKKTRIYLWSGDTTPFEGAIRETRAAGIRNINGGDSRLDREFPSVTYVPPISRVAGKERQIYAANSNENTYTNDWTGPYYGYFMLEETLKNTDSPRRLKPFNLYYHMYSGEKTAALASVKHFLDMARRSEVVPVTASDYAAIADDFFGVEVEQVDLFTWAVRNRGALQTVRFDDAEAYAVDLSASVGVLGARRHEGALYIALDSALAEARVALRSRNSETVDSAPRSVGLEQARWRLSNQHAEDCGFRIDAQGFGPGEFVWRGAKGTAFRIIAERGGVVLFDKVERVDADGRLAFTMDLPAAEPLLVRLACHE